jgi:hypothetical protein
MGLLIVAGLLVAAWGLTAVRAEEPADEVRLLRAQNGLLKATIEARDKKIAELQEEIKKLEGKAETQDKRIAQLQKEVQRLTAEIASLPAKEDPALKDKPATQPAVAPETVNSDVKSPVLVTIGDGSLRVRFQFTTLYIPANIPKGEDILVEFSRTEQCGYSRFLFVAFQPSAKDEFQKPIRGFFKVNGTAEKLAFKSSDEKVVRILSYDDDEGLRVEALAGGSADIIITLGIHTVKIPIRVVQIPVNTGDWLGKDNAGKPSHTQDDIIKILGLPDNREETHVSWPNSAGVVGQHFSPVAGRHLRIVRWTYRKYPGAEIIFVNDTNALYARSAQQFDYAEAGRGKTE